MSQQQPGQMMMQQNPEGQYEEGQEEMTEQQQMEYQM